MSPEPLQHLLQEGLEQLGLVLTGPGLPGYTGQDQHLDGSFQAHSVLWDDVPFLWSLAVFPNISPFLCSFKQQNLEQRQSDVEYELRCLLNKPGKAPLWACLSFFHRIMEYIELEGIKGQGSFFPWASSPHSLGGSQVKRGRSVGMANAISWL